MQGPLGTPYEDGCFVYFMTLSFYIDVLFYLIGNVMPLDDELMSIIHIGRCTTPEELANSIMNPSLDAVLKINNVFEDGTIKGTCYSENVYNAIINELRKN